MSDQQLEVHLRMLHSGDARWMVALGRDEDGPLPPFAPNEDKLAAELDEGIWASEEQVGWAVMVDGEPAGVAFARNLTSREGVLDIWLRGEVRGRGVGREALRQLADHHFADDPRLRRLEGRTHEDNVAMQRAFTAAGFLMEARYRDSLEQADGTLASEWGYAMTRADWKAGRHRADDEGYNLHGLTFTLETDPEEPEQMPRGAASKFLQERHRVLIRYEGGKVTDGEAAGILLRDSLRYRFMHIYRDHELVTGWGQSHVQRRGDGRLEIVDEVTSDDGQSSRHLWVERR